MPKAIKSTFWRVLFFYLGSIFFIGLALSPVAIADLVKTNDIASSPFVATLQLSGIPGASSIINAVCLVAVLSAANSSMYARYKNTYNSSRIMISMCRAGMGPKILGKVNSRGVPTIPILIAACFGILSMLAALIGEGVVFSWLLSIGTLNIKKLDCVF